VTITVTPQTHSCYQRAREQPGPTDVEQLHELLTLLKEAGHTDFRDARGSTGFTQRQAAGKFTHDAAALIDRLQGR